MALSISLRSSKLNSARVFFGIARDSDDKLIEKLAAPLYQVEVSVRYRIERARINSDDLFHAPSDSCYWYPGSPLAREPGYFRRRLSNRLRFYSEQR